MLALTDIYNHWTINVSEQKFPHRQATAPASIRKLSAGPSSELDCDKMARHTPWTTAERPLPPWKSNSLGSVRFINTTSSTFLLVCELNRAIRRLAYLMHSPTCLTPINIYENTAIIHPARALACLETPPERPGRSMQRLLGEYFDSTELLHGPLHYEHIGSHHTPVYLPASNTNKNTKSCLARRSRLAGMSAAALHARPPPDPSQSPRDPRIHQSQRMLLI